MGGNQEDLEVVFAVFAVTGGCMLLVYCSICLCMSCKCVEEPKRGAS